MKHSSKTHRIGHGRVGLTVALLLCFGSVANANVGTPVIWLGMAHLTIGNLLIGSAEGLLLSWLYRVRKARAVGVMIVGNYVSAAIGFGLVNRYAVGGLPGFRGPMIETFVPMIATALIIAFLLTLVLELPFVRFTLHGEAGTWRKAIIGSIIIQTVTYTLMLGVYASVSSISLFTNTKTVSFESLFPPEDLVLVFKDIGSHDWFYGDLHLRNWQPLGIEGQFSALIQTSPVDDNTSPSTSWRIFNFEGDEILIPIQSESVTGTLSSVSRGEQQSVTNRVAIGVHAPGGVQTNRQRREFVVETPRQSYTLRADSPLSPWGLFSRPIMIAPDLVLFGFSFDGVLALNPETRQIAFVVPASDFFVLPRADFEAWLADVAESTEE